MDGIFTILILFGIVNSIIKWVKKQQLTSGNKNQNAAPEKPWQRMIGEFTKTIEDSMSGKPKESSPFPPVTMPKAKPAAVSAVNREGTGLEGTSASGSISSRRSPFLSPYAVTGEGTSTPMEPRPVWQGSMSGSPAESVRTAESMAYSSSPYVAQPESSPLNLSFNRDSLLKAVVMHEILTRPQERKRRWSHH